MGGGTKRYKTCVTFSFESHHFPACAVWWPPSAQPKRDQQIRWSGEGCCGGTAMGHIHDLPGCRKAQGHTHKPCKTAFEVVSRHPWTWSSEDHNLDFSLFETWPCWVGNEIKAVYARTTIHPLLPVNPLHFILLSVHCPLWSVPSSLAPKCRWSVLLLATMVGRQPTACFLGP